MLIALKHKKVVEKFVKKTFMVKNTHFFNGHMLYVHIVTEIKETYFEIYIYQESCLLALPI